MTGKQWFIVWRDGRVVTANSLPPRPLDALPENRGVFTPYYETYEHRHKDGSFHVLADNAEKAIERARSPEAEQFPLQQASGRLLSIRKTKQS